ncbi:unnamed protein product [Allacma fusca]|uniref:Uncharacterized protein n=1 Tax=Allacma fusca TaxID=39272 RepID=A0A8J2K6F4_9HEXA|nr:unnamed protein product [Allacma fusca]
MSAEKGQEDNTDTEERDVETTAKKIPYPKSVFFILANEFCERFSFYGMKGKNICPTPFELNYRSVRIL